MLKFQGNGKTKKKENKIIYFLCVCVCMFSSSSIYLFLKVITCFSLAKNKLVKKFSRRLFFENSKTAMNDA